MHKDFILGVGCQKGGTTWLRSQLHRHETCDFGFQKEYHVFDRLYDLPKFSTKFNKNSLKIKYKDLNLPNKNDPSSYQREHFLLDPQNYYDYFESLFLNNKILSTTGDVTPAYAGLPIEAFKKLKEKLEEKQFKVKVIFLMRDPIERIWSHARMTIERYKVKGKKIPSDYQSLLDSADENNLELPAV